MKRDEKISIFQAILPWLATAAVIAFAIMAEGSEPQLGTNEYRKVAWVDQNGNVNVPEVIATVARQATNEVNIIIANEKADAAESAARNATNVIKDVVSSIVRNDVRIYRKGSLVSFDPFIDWDPDVDYVLTTEIDVSSTPGRIGFGYVASKDIGITKPLIYEHDTLGDGTQVKVDWDLISASDIAVPTVHDEQIEFRGLFYDKWYSTDIPYYNDGQHFFVLDMNLDTPEGDGMTLDIRNGFTGGFTGTVVDGSLEKTYVGGLLKNVRNVDE